MADDPLFTQYDRTRGVTERLARLPFRVSTSPLASAVPQASAEEATLSESWTKRDRALDLYNTAEQSFTVATIQINWDIQRVIDDETFTHTLGDDEITINQSGRFEIHITIVGDAVTASTSNVLRFALQRDTGSGFAEVTGAFGYLLCDTVRFTGEDSKSRSLIIDLTAGDKLRVVVARTNGAGTVKTLANGCGLTIRRLVGAS